MVKLMMSQAVQGPISETSFKFGGGGGEEIPLEPLTITLQLGVQHSETYYNVKIDLNALSMI